MPLEVTCEHVAREPRSYFCVLNVEILNLVLRAQWMEGSIYTQQLALSDAPSLARTPRVIHPSPFLSLQKSLEPKRIPPTPDRYKKILLPVQSYNKTI